MGQVGKTTLRLTPDDKGVGLTREDLLSACEEAARQGTPNLVKVRVGWRGQIIEMVFSS